jgi:hypothetical protein
MTMSKPSREREEQQRVLKRAATEESWIKRLLRSLTESNGRPKPGNPQNGSRERK